MLRSLLLAAAFLAAPASAFADAAKRAMYATERAKDAAERAMPGDIMLFGGPNFMTFMGCLRCGGLWYGLGNRNLCRNEYRYHAPSNPFAGVIQNLPPEEAVLYSPWNPEGIGPAVMRREVDGWAYLGALTVNPDADPSPHPIPQAIMRAYERTGSARGALHEVCKQMYPDDS